MRAPLPKDVIEAPVTGVNLMPGTLGDQLAADDATLLVFLRRYWPDARAVADPHKRFYAGFGIGRGGLRQLFGPGVWSAARRARRKGLTQGRGSGDLWMMPGVFLVRGREIVWAHEYAHAGDQPVFACIPEAAGLV